MQKMFLIILFLYSCLNAQARILSNVTDYFRSVQTGNWNALTTWESSPNNTNWTAATLIPNSAANTISIRFGNTVTYSTNGDLDQVVIENGGMLIHAANGMLINDGAGDDVDVQSGGIFTLASNSNPPVFFSGLATTNISTGAVLRVSATGLTSASPGPGVNTSNYIYQHASVLEYTPNLAFASAGVTFFPNANAATIPVFRTTANLGLIGGAAPTVINGIFEANGTITFQNAGTKTFRNGITGTGNINSDPACGKFIINGTAAMLGGTGSLTLPAAGMDIGASSTVTMLASKAITGNVALLANSFINLGNFNLTLAGDISGGSVTSHVVSNGMGKLVLNNITALPRFFPVGPSAAMYNPVIISNGGGFNYAVRVQTGINPAIVVPLNAVNRTWFVTAMGGNPAAVSTGFYYAAGDANAGFNYSANLELGQHTGVWNIVQTGLVPTGSYQVATTVSTLGNNIEAPLVLANLYAILAVNNAVSVDYFSGIKQSGKHLLRWRFTCNSTAATNLFLERSANGIDYAGIFSEHVTALRCQQPFTFNDSQPNAGINYYRLKMIDADGKTFYSTIITLINANTGIYVLKIAPNPVADKNFSLKFSAAKQQVLEFFITDVQGRILQVNKFNAIAGFNVIPVHIAKLPNGLYQLILKTAGEKVTTLRFVVQR